MRRKKYAFLKAALLVLAAMALIFAGCSEDGDDDTDAATDGSHWDLMSSDLLLTPGAVWPFSAEEAIVAADSEHVYHTTDGGQGWRISTIDPATGRGASDMYFTSSAGVLCGDLGMLYKTHDDGETWSDVSPAGVSEMESNLFGITAAPGDNPLYVAGSAGGLARSTDLGESWEDIDVAILVAESTMVVDSTGDTTWDDTDVYLEQNKLTFHGGSAPSASVVFIAADTLTTDDEYYFLHSADGGDSWEMLTVGLSGRFPACHFFDDSSGLVFGDDGAIYRVTLDSAGITTDYITLLGSGMHLSGSYFQDENTGWVTGAGGTVARTTDGGDSWELMDVDVTGTIEDIEFYSSWIVGDDQSRGAGAIKLTTDGGDSWWFRSFGLGLSLNAAHFVSEMEGWVAGKSGRIARTTDGGALWIHQDAGVSKTFQDLYFTDSNHGWAVGFATSGAVDTFSTILYTDNGGETWTSLDSVYGRRLNAVEFVDNSTGWSVGDNGSIFKTVDGGASWTLQSYGGSVELFGIEVMNENELFVVGQYGNILHTTDGGTSWETHDWPGSESATEQTLYDIDFPTGSVGYACGSMGTVWKTSDGGGSWELLELPPYSNTLYKSVAFASDQSGWIVGKFGYILHTVDGGETWYRQEEGFSESSLNEVFVYNPSHAWIVGDDDIIMELVPGS